MDYQKLKELIPKKSTEWSIDNVVSWLNFIHLSSFVQHFRHHSIDGSCLQLLTEDDLRNELKITSNITVKKLLNWINEGLPAFDLSIENSDNLIQSLLETSLSYDADEIIVTQKNNNDPVESEINLRKSVKKRKLAPLLIRRVDSTDIACHRFVQQNIKIGRGFFCDLIVESQQIQIVHAQLILANNHCYLKNSSSNSETYIKLQGRTKMANLMVIQMGAQIYKFTIKRDQIKAQIISGIQKGWQYIFDQSKSKISIGRKSTNDISSLTDTTLSNFHAKISFHQNYWTFEDLETTNGSWMEIVEEIKITDGSIFKLGDTNNHIFKCEFEKQERKKSKKNSLCVKCLQRERKMLFFPCNHYVVCEECCTGLQVCVVCNEKLSSTIKIFQI